MADNTNKTYTREALNSTSTKVKDLRPIARSLKISKPENMKKEPLINAILQNQNIPLEKVKPTPKIFVINDSELSLKLISRVTTMYCCAVEYVVSNFSESI